MKTRFQNLLNTGLSAYQIARVCEQENIRLSVMGWSKYAVEDGVLNFHHDYRGEEYTEDIQSAEELNFFDPARVAAVADAQTITTDIIKALRS